MNEQHLKKIKMAESKNLNGGPTWRQLVFYCSSNVSMVTLASLVAAVLVRH